MERDSWSGPPTGQAKNAKWALVTKQRSFPYPTSARSISSTGTSITSEQPPARRSYMVSAVRLLWNKIPAVCVPDGQMVDFIVEGALELYLEFGTQVGILIWECTVDCWSIALESAASTRLSAVSEVARANKLRNWHLRIHRTLEVASSLETAPL